MPQRRSASSAQARGTLRISARSAVVAVAMLGATLALLRLVAAAERVLGWMIAAAIVAALLHPVVVVLSRRVSRSMAVLVVVVGTLTVVGGVTYGVVNGVVRETRRLQAAAPRRAAELESGGRFAEVARELHLEQRTRAFVEEVPERLRGGTPAEALRAAATRGVAFLATAVLSLFLLLHGPQLVRGALDQIPDPQRRARLAEIAGASYRRGFGYAAGSIAMSAAAGLIAYALALATDVPGAAPLALWMALWDLVPVLGVVVGGLPLVVLAGAGSAERALLVAAVIVAYQIFEVLVLQRAVERRTMRLGPFPTIAAGLVGLEVYGIAGALVCPLAAALTIAAIDKATDQPP